MAMKWGELLKDLVWLQLEIVEKRDLNAVIEVGSESLDRLDAIYGKLVEGTPDPSNQGAKNDRLAVLNSLSSKVPVLQGSPKQESYAQSVRTRWMDWFRHQPVEFCLGNFEELSCVLRQVSAPWWISTNGFSWGQMVEKVKRENYAIEDPPPMRRKLGSRTPNNLS